MWYHCLQLKFWSIKFKLIFNDGIDIEAHNESQHKSGAKAKESIAFIPMMSENTSEFDLSQRDDELFLSMQNRGRTQSFVEKKKWNKFNLKPKSSNKRFSIIQNPSLLSLESPCFGQKYFK